MPSFNIATPSLKVVSGPKGKLDYSSFLTLPAGLHENSNGIRMFGSGGQYAHGVYQFELFDKDNNSVKKVTKRFHSEGAGTPQPGILLSPAAVSSDPGGATNYLVYNCAVAEFSTGRVVASFSGYLGDPGGNSMSLDLYIADPLPTGGFRKYQDVTLFDSGSIEFSIDFSMNA